MTKRKLLIIAAILLSIPFAVLWEGDSAIKGGENAAKGSFFILSNPGIDESDLDARDAQNQPLHSTLQSAFLAALFQESLYRLSVIEAPHFIRQSMDGLNLYLRLFLNSFFNNGRRLWRFLEQAIAPSKKRIVHNGDNRWITSAVGLFTVFCLSLRFNLANRPLRLHLRC